jgi:polar amino acid transport system substrate-binding protein
MFNHSLSCLARRWFGLFAQPASKTLIISAAALFIGSPLSASAQTCGVDYLIKEGDSLAKIAGEVYGKPSNWTMIFYANQDRLGANATLLVPGLAIRIPCVAGTQAVLPDIATTPAVARAKPQAFEFSPLIKHVEFLTADDFAPFTTRSLANGGLFTELLTTAMSGLQQESDNAFDFKVSWVNDWSAHLNPLLLTRSFDMGFPWAKPDCKDFVALNDDAKFRCQKFFFSDALMEERTVAFVKNESTFEFNTDDEIIGKTVCRPTGYLTFDLDQNARNWLRDSKITLLRPQSVDECMQMLADGRTDLVSVAELPGRTSLIRLALGSKIRTLDRPMHVSGLHVVVAKTHPNGRSLIYYVNTALKKLRESGEYDRISERQMQAYFDGLAESEAKAAPAPTAEVAPVAPADATPQPADEKPLEVPATATATKAATSN